MIEVSPTTALMIYLCLTLCVLLGLWALQHSRTRKTEILPIEKNMQTCEFCLFAYLVEDTKPITKCPRCSSFNQYKK